MSINIGSMIDFESGSSIDGPARALAKDKFALPDLPTAYELEEAFKSTSSKAHSVPSTPAPGTYTPRSLAEADDEDPGSPSPSYGLLYEERQSFFNPSINKYRVLATCLLNFQNGMNDAAPGALIPYLEKQYGIGYAVVSLIFVTNAVGFLSAATLTHALERKIGRSKAYVVAEALVLLAYIALVCNPPFWIVVVSFFFIGLGQAINLAFNNVFCANLNDNTTILGLLHGSYGIGGTISPLIATALVSHGRTWSVFYYLVLAVTIFNAVLAFYTFRNYEKDSPSSHNPLRPTPSNPTGSESQFTLLKQALKNRTTVLGALFIFCYQGAEVSISGWVISFLINYRHGSPERVGYVTSGFWGGITLGRFLLSHPAHRFGEKKATFLLVAGAAAFQLLVWLVPNVVGEAVAVSIVGLLLGPVYPCAAAVFSRLIPLKLQVNSLATVSALGSSGGAVAPFFTGLLAQRFGTLVLHPIVIGLFAGMAGFWAALPKLGKRRE